MNKFAMQGTIELTADDFGLTRRATDAILETADHGVLTRVSVIPNGHAVTYALKEWEKRKDRLFLSVHINLTEGRALSDPRDIPHLAHADGTFRYSPVVLLLLTTFGFSRALREEIHKEVTIQVEHIRSKAGDVPLSIDGHQHIQMIPAVFSIITTLHQIEPFSNVRISREPFFFAPAALSAYIGSRLLRHLGLNFFSRLQATTHMPHTDYFIGTLLSGEQTFLSIRSALSEAVREQGKSIEIGLHPGVAISEEVEEWKGDRAWHIAPLRRQEQALLMSPELRELVGSFREGTFVPQASRGLEIFRFVIAGGMATATNLVLLYVLTDGLHLWYVASAIVSYSIATVVSFTLQKFWAFSHHSLKRTKRELLLYVLNNILGVAFDIVALYVLVEFAGVWYMAAQSIALALIALWNFFIFRFVIFRAEKNI